MYLVILEDGAQIEFSEESHVPEDDSVTLVVKLDERDKALTKYNREGGYDMVVALSGLLMKTFNLGFSRGREDSEGGQLILGGGASLSIMRGGGDGPLPGFLSRLKKAPEED